MHVLPDFARSLAAFVAVLGVLVFVHEMGHYLAARWRGIHVEAFSIGFGQSIARWTDRRGTVWKLAWIPLGGYVKLHGQERPEDAPPEVRTGWLRGRTFHEKTVGSRAIVIAAGPVANFLLAAALFAALFAVLGRPTASPVINGVLPDSPAAAAGLQPGDRITAIGKVPVQHFSDVQSEVGAKPGQAIVVGVERGSQALSLPVTVGSRGEGADRVGVLGIQGGAVEYEPVSPLAAIPDGIAQTWDVTRQTVIGIAQMIAGTRGTGDIGGPLRIAQLSGKVAELGFASLVGFVAVLSVNLGLINLFPIPILDGGHLLFYALEALRGRPLPPRAQEIGFRAGFALLASLFVFATWNDLAHLGVVHWLTGRAG
jgi:regulator of sigma E protease